MIRFSIACILACWVGAASAQQVTGTPGNVSGSAVTATGSTTSRTLQDRFAQVINVKDYGAVGNGIADDSAAFVAAINQENAYSAAGTPAIIYVPGGTYLLSANTLPTMTRGGAIVGDGQHKTYIMVGTSYSGDVFSWSLSWMAADYGGSTLVPANDKAGPILKNLSIVGNTSATNVQNAIEFYDEDDFVNIENVDVYFMHGQCLGMGATKSAASAYVRESYFANLQCWDTGTASLPAISVSSTTNNGSDASNELKFYRIQIFRSAGVGLSITNPNNFSATRLIEFFGLRVENSGADNIQVGSQADAGQINDIYFYGVESLSPGAANSGFYALNLDTTGQQEYSINVYGATLGPCGSGTCNGLNIGNIRLSSLQILNIGATGTSVNYTANAGTSIVLNGNGAEQGWSYTYGGGVYKNYNRAPIYKSGDPGHVVSFTSASPSITAFYHDGSSSFGNSQGAGAVDLQIIRSSPGQVASGTISALIAGEYNTASGFAGFIGGGIQATDRGRSATQAFGGGNISTPGDAQAAHFVLSATCASCSSQQLAVQHAAASATNIANISNNQSYAMSWRCVARDTTTAGTDNATTMPIMLMTRDANAASTAVALGTPATATRGTWTGGGFTFAADTTNGGVKITFTSPTGNTDTFHTVCEGLDAETQ
jgi:hypothetical protein